jgi:sulfite reductase (ferredoxin)
MFPLGWVVCNFVRTVEADMFKLPQKITEDISNYKVNLERFLKGELKDAFFRGIRVPWGFYSQRGGKILMARLRIPAGILTAKQLKVIGEAAEKFANGQLHITTRQDIQIHNVPYENSIKIIEFLKDFDISPRGGGGNTVRNITACYLSGVCPYERVEVHQIACGLTEYLLSLDESYNLPRKFKIAFSGCHKDCCAVGVNDMGFISNNNGFKVIVGGGMGARSTVGKVLEEDVSIEDVGYVVKAVMNVFNKYGDRKNRHHNRLRFLIEDVSWNKFRELYETEYKKIKEEEYIVLRLADGLPELPKLEDANLIGCAVESQYNEFIKYNTGKQKQKGYYYAQIRIPLGEVNSEQLIRLSELESLTPDIVFRTTQRQNIVVTNIPYNKMFYVYEKIKEIFDDFLYPETLIDIVSCKAALTCNLGICNAIYMAKEIINELKKVNSDIIKIKDVNIHINGCPNACGRHPIGTISFSGLAKKVYNKTVPFYKVYFGGKINAEKTKLAEEVGVVPARNVPRLLLEIASILQDSLSISEPILNNLVRKYSYVPSYEEDRSFYIDFGKSEDFSLAGLSHGECGAGVLDMINSDLDSAKQILLRIKEDNFNLNEIRDAIIYSARALLVVRGVDPKDEKETIENFLEKFVKVGIINPVFGNIMEIYTRLKTGGIDGETGYKYANELYAEVKEVYSLMDSNFNFPARYTELQTSTSKQTFGSLVYDLRGTPCPINYVKIKLKLEELKIGDVLEVYLDDGEPIHNVPKSLKEDGQEILKIVQADESYFRVFIRKNV